MLSGKAADHLRGTDLNRALLSDFSGYHDVVFQRLVDALFLRKESQYHYRHFSLVTKDVAAFFPENQNPGLEVTLRRFLFVIGLSICGYCPWSLLDEEMQQKIVLQYTQAAALDSTWDILIEPGKMIIREYCSDIAKAERYGLHPREAGKLLEFLFPNLAKHWQEQNKLYELQEKVFEQLEQLGIVEVQSYFDPSQLKYFGSNIQKCLATLMESAWMNAEVMSSIVAQNPNRTYDFPANDLEQLHSELFRLLQQQPRPDLERVQELLTLLTFWERWCFGQYLKTAHIQAGEIDTMYLQTFLLNRCYQVKLASQRQKQELLEEALSLQWIEEISDDEITWLQKLPAWCGIEKHASVLLYHELEVHKNLHIDTSRNANEWKAIWQEQHNQLSKHPFFPTSLKQEVNAISLANFVIHHCGDLWKSQLSKVEQQQLQTLSKLSFYTQQFPWADLAIMEQCLELLQKGLSSLAKKMKEDLRGPNCEMLMEIPQDWNAWEQIIAQAWAKLQVAQEEPARFIYDHFGDKFCNTQKSDDFGKSVESLTWLCFNLVEQWKKLQSQVHCHILAWTMQADEVPLEFLYNKLKRIGKWLAHDPHLTWYLEKIQYIAQAIEAKKLGKQYALYSQCILILQELEPLCVSWSEYANMPHWSGTTIRQVKPLTPWNSPNERPLFEQFQPELLTDLVVDQLQARITRFVVQVMQKNLDMGILEKKAVTELLQCFYQNGLLLTESQVPKFPMAGQLYSILYQHTNHFQNLPNFLMDLRKIAAARWNSVSSDVLQRAFLEFLPTEVQEPNFNRSVLMEFLQYQFEAARSPQPGMLNINKKILWMQLQREYTELQQKYQVAQTKYSEHLLAVSNFALIHDTPETQTLLSEARNWPLKLRLFQDYLATEQYVLDSESKQRPWN